MAVVEGPFSPDSEVPAHATIAGDLDLALQLADTADRISMGRFRAGDLQVATKPDLTPVTEADQAVEQELRAALSRARPGDQLLGEEYGGTVGPGRLWIIDPIDGTKNYVRAVPVWATLIALAIDGEVVLGVASAPALGRRWWAARGLGAFAGPTGGAPGDITRLRVSQVSDLADASFSYSDPVGWPAGALERLATRAWRVRAYGDFWSHVLVAEGCVDIAAEPELNVWDFAALIPIVTEAGGRIAGFDGVTGLAARSALTTNSLLDRQSRDLLASDTDGSPSPRP